MSFTHPVIHDSNYKGLHVRPGLDTGPGLTKQSHKKSTDINLIMAKYQKTGMISFGTNERPEFMSIDGLDFQDALDTVIIANEMFAQMPSSYRKRFNNDPKEFLDFVDDPANLEEMYDLGLATRPPPPATPPVTPAPDPAPSVPKPVP